MTEALFKFCLEKAHEYDLELCMGHAYHALGRIAANNSNYDEARREKPAISALIALARKPPNPT